MKTSGRGISPVETARAHLVSKEDVGHGTASAGRNDGYERRSKLRVTKTDNASGMRKSNTGEVEGDDESAEEGAEDEDQTESDADATDEEDVPRFKTSGKSVLSRMPVASQPDSSPLKRKRTASELSSTTILSTIERDDENEEEYPRKRMSRRLSNEHGLLRYDPEIMEVDEDIDVAEYSKAIESSSEDETAVANDSDDETAVNDDDEVDDDLIEEEEEALILEEEEFRDINGTAASSVVGAESDLELPSDLDLGFLNSEMDDVFDNGDSFFFRGFNNDSDSDTPRRKKSDASARRVRFLDEIDIAHNHTYSSSTTSTETDIDIFPDLLDNPFKSQDELPATLRNQIEDDEEAEVGNAASSDGEGSVWDFGEEKASENFFAWHDEAGSESDDESGSDLSGYDSDGDTTDDDLPPPSTIRAARSLLHSRTPSTVTTELATPNPFPRNRRRGRGPIMGSFIVDERKAMAFIDPNTKQLRIQPARIQSYGDQFNSTASSVNNSPQVNFNGMAYDSDNSELTRLITGPSDVMMSGVFGGLPGQRYEDGRFVMEANSGPLLIGPPEAFYAFTSIRTDGTPEEEDDYDTEQEFDDDCDLITAFLDMSDDDADGQEPELAEEDITSPTTTDAPDSTPARPRGMTNILDHLDRGVVSSFRNHQDRHRHTSGLPHDYNQDSTPIRDGRTADDVMTPLRKRRGGGILKKTAVRRMPVMGGFS